MYASVWTKFEIVAKNQGWGQNAGRKIIENVRMISSMIIGAVVVIGCLLQINIHSTKDYADDYKYKTAVEGEILTGETFERGRNDMSVAEVYYQKKIEKLKNDYLNQIKNVQ